MKLPYQVMGCGLSKSASKAARDAKGRAGSRQGQGSHDDAYVRTPTISVEKVTDPQNPCTDELKPLSGGSGKPSLPNGDSLSNSNKDQSHNLLKDRSLTASNTNGPRVSDSQLEFFRMLDDKVEQGRDYTSESEASGFGT